MNCMNWIVYVGRKNSSEYEQFWDIYGYKSLFLKPFSTFFRGTSNRKYLFAWLHSINVVMYTHIMWNKRKTLLCKLSEVTAKIFIFFSPLLFGQIKNENESFVNSRFIVGASLHHPCNKTGKKPAALIHMCFDGIIALYSYMKHFLRVRKTDKMHDILKSKIHIKMSVCALQTFTLWHIFEPFNESRTKRGWWNEPFLISIIQYWLAILTLKSINGKSFQFVRFFFCFAPFRGIYHWNGFLILLFIPGISKFLVCLKCRWILFNGPSNAHKFQFHLYDSPSWSVHFSKWTGHTAVWA